MNKFNLAIFTLIIAISGLSVRSLAVDSYPMVCRGGGQLQSRAILGNSRYTGKGIAAEVTITFKRALSNTNENGSGLQPGECSWLDRAINAGEPNVVADQNIDGSLVQTNIGTSIGTSELRTSYTVLHSLNGDLNYVRFSVSNAGPYFIRDQKINPVFFTR